MKDAVFILRTIAMALWMASGILAGGLPGYLSAIASLIFMTAAFMERK